MRRQHIYVLVALILAAANGNTDEALSVDNYSCDSVPRPENAGLPLSELSDDWYQVYEAADGVYSIVEQTWVDGVREFARAADLASRAQIEREREELIRRVRTGDSPAKADEDESKQVAAPEETKTHAPQPAGRPIERRSPTAICVSPGRRAARPSIGWPRRFSNTGSKRTTSCWSRRKTRSPS